MIIISVLGQNIRKKIEEWQMTIEKFGIGPKKLTVVAQNKHFRY